MPIPYPRCGVEDLHEPHLLAYSEVQCPGWTAGQQLARSLITGVRKYMREHYPSMPGVPPELPPGLRLEMHPSVRRVLMTDPDLWEPGGGAWDEAPDHFFAPAPVKVTMDIPAGTWRLVIVTEEVLLSGK